MSTKTYYETKAPNYRISAGRLQHILDLLPDSPVSILDIGCAGGELARALRERGHRVWGVDISQQALALAAPALERGFCFDVSVDVWPDELRALKFDVVIASEVIEHLFDSAHFLVKIRKLLKTGGQAIITTPNFLFWKNRLRMFLGAFRYEREGLLDFGHIRFFTPQTAREAFARAGLAVVREHHYYPNLEHRGLGVIGRWAPGVFAYQMVFQLKTEGDRLVDTDE